MGIETLNPFNGELDLALLSHEKSTSLTHELAVHRILQTDSVPLHPFKPRFIDRSAVKVRFLVPDGRQVKATVSLDAQGMYTIHTEAYSQFQPTQHVDIVAQKETGLVAVNMQNMKNQVIHCVGDNRGTPNYEGQGILKKPYTKLVIKFGDPFKYSGHSSVPDNSQSHIVQLHRSDYFLNQDRGVNGAIYKSLKHNTYGFRTESGSLIAVKSVVVYEENRPSFILITPLSNADYFFDHLNSDKHTAIIVRKTNSKMTKIYHNCGNFDIVDHVIRDGNDLFLRNEELPERGVPVVLADCEYIIGEHQLRSMYVHDEQLSTHFFGSTQRAYATQ